MKKLSLIILSLVLAFFCLPQTFDSALAIDNLDEAEESQAFAYVGLYPQTIVDDDIIYDDLYVLSESKQPDFLDWYYYDENYYAMIETKNVTDERVFSNGKKIVANRKYFFKCEKIKWNVKEVEDNFVLTSDLIIDVSNYYENLSFDYATVFSASDAYELLNGKMLSAIEFKEKQTLVDLELNHDTNYNLNEDKTKFKVNLPSIDKCSFNKNKELMKHATDYCLAKGIEFSEIDGENFSPYWSSSVGCSTKNMLYFSSEGETIYNKNINEKLGILPMIAIKKV